MADNVQPNFFTRTFNNLVNRLPYTGNTNVINNIKELNPKFETFYNVSTSQKNVYINKQFRQLKIL